MKSLCRFSIIAAALLAIASISSTLRAQSTTGTIFGSVLDPTGASIPAAKVTLTEVHTNVSQTATTDSKGDYTYAIVNPGDYSVTATATGFKTVTQTNITLSANQNIRVPFSLAAGNVTETVEVEAGVTLVDTREAQLGETIDQSKIEDLPTPSRDAYSLVTTVPGVTNYVADSPIGTRVGASFSVNGLSKDQTSYYLDGSYDNTGNNGGNKIPNPDALSEFRVLTSNFDAEFGRTPAAVINVITRSGTDHFHGAAYDYLRNNILNARNYFVAPTSPTNPAVQLNENQFGGRIGGPVKLLPQTFFFLDYQGTVLRTQAVINAGLVQSPSATERMGSFAGDTFGTAGTFKRPNLPAGTNCGTTAAPVICAAALDPVAQAVLKLVPVGAPGTHLIGQQVGQADSFSNEGLVRFDFNHFKNHAIEAMLYYSRGNDTTPNSAGNQVLGYSGATDTEQQFNIVAADIWTLSDRTVNSFRAFASRNHYTIFNEYNQSIQGFGSQLQPGGTVAAPSAFNLTGYVNIGGGAARGPANVDQPAYGGIDTLNLTRGTHSIKLGGSYVYSKIFNISAQQAGGNFAFTGSTTGNTFADFLLGRANSLNETNIVQLRNYSYDPALYAQDDWQITRRLNLNLGVRWEVFAPYLGGGDTFGTFAPGVQSTVVPSAPVGILYSGDKNIPSSLFNISYRDFAPRVGFAYDAFGNGRTSVRGGFGVFYFESDSINSNEQVQSPFGLSVTTNQTPNLVCPYGGTAPPCPVGTPAGTDPFPYDPTHPDFANPAAGSEVFAIPSNGGSTPYVYEYNLTVEQQLSPTFALHIAYVGDAVRKQYIVANKLAIDENAPVYQSPTDYANSAFAKANPTVTELSAAGLLERRPYEPYTRSTAGSGFRFGRINLNSPVENSNYSSLQTTLRGRFGRKFSMFASYVWSKSLNYDGPIINNYDIGMNYGPGADDLRHRFVVSYLYELPTTTRFGIFGREVLDGWHVNGITAFQSGNPFTVTSGTDTNFDGYTNDLVNVIGNPNLGHLSRAQRIQRGTLNPAALSTPTGPYGNEQKNQFYGPANINTDLSLFKEFPIFEQARLQFRAEAFNAFNNVNLNNPNLTLTQIQNTSIPQITGSAPARTLQFAAKLTF